MIKIINGHLSGDGPRKNYRVLLDGDCSSTAECTTVARETGVRLPSFALSVAIQSGVEKIVKMKKKISKKFDIIWKIIGWIILILFIYNLIRINQGLINNTLSIIIIISLLVYAIISAIIFLPSTLKKFFKKLK